MKNSKRDKAIELRDKMLGENERLSSVELMLKFAEAQVVEELEDIVSVNPTYMPHFIGERVAELKKEDLNSVKERLDSEIEGLRCKLSKLDLFLTSGSMEGISQESQHLLGIQSKAMSTYLIVLELRYKQFKTF